MTGPLKWHGEKKYLSSWIVGLMPPRCQNPNKPDPADPGWLHYVEPYAGGLSVLLAMDPEGVSEVANDLNGDLANFWQVLSDPDLIVDLERRLSATPFSEALFDDARSALAALDLAAQPAERAYLFFVVCRQSLAGRMDSFAPRSRSRTRQGMNEQVSAWLTAVEGLPAVHARLKRVLILNDDALAVIRKEDGPRTLFYLDPPYLHETRATTGEYEHEMTELQHVDLLKLLGTIKGRFLLSGYRSSLYDTYAVTSGWKCYEKATSNHAASGKTKRVMTECVWTNF